LATLLISGIDVSGNISTSGGDVMMLGFCRNNCNKAMVIRDIAATGGNRTIDSGSGDITFLTRYPSYDYGSNKLTLTSTGHLTLAPLSGATYFTSAINLNGTTTGGTLTGANDLGGLVINNVANLTGLTLGNYLGSGVAGDTPYVYANTSTMTLSAPFSIAGPISVYGSNINVNANLNTTAGGSSGDILLKASADISLAAGKSITTSGGDVVLWSNSDGGADTGSVLLRDGSSITTSGGHLWAGGGSGSTTWNGLTVGSGYAVAGTSLAPAACVCSPFKTGIYLEATTLNTGGGSIGLWGNGGSADHGILSVGNNTLNAGAGKVYLRGVGSSTGGIGLFFGIHYTVRSAQFNVASTNQSTDAITLVGSANGGNGIFAGSTLLEATNGGGINVTASTNSASAFAMEVGYLNNAASLVALANSGPVVFDVGRGLSAASAGFLVLGQRASSSVTSSSSNITLIGNSFSWGTTASAVQSSGILSIKPSTVGATIGVGSGAGTLSLPNNFFTGSSVFKNGFSGIVLGAADAGHITVGGTNAFVDSVTLLSGGNITLNASSSVSSSQASGYVALAATGSFINNAGASALSTASDGRWLVYSASPTSAGTNFGNLNSANAPVWGQTYATQLPSAVAVTGNRYVFASIPTVTVTANSVSKTYGDVLSGTSLLGLSSSATGSTVFTLPTLTDVFSVQPTAASAGLVTTATVAGGPYAITLTPGTARSGYSVSYATPGSITVTTKALTVTGTSVAHKVYDGGFGGHTQRWFFAGRDQQRPCVSGASGQLCQQERGQRHQRDSG
jgi:hypothetical protein